MSAGIAATRLGAERKSWRTERPFGFYARPNTNPDGSLNLMRWTCGIPGKAGTPWANAIYPLSMEVYFYYY